TPACLRPARRRRRSCGTTPRRRQRPAAGSGGVRVAELSLDAPIVRQIQGAPAGIVERPFLSAGDVAQVESPSAVEAESRALALWRRRRVRGDEQREERDDRAGYAHGRATTLTVRL